MFPPDSQFELCGFLKAVDEKFEIFWGKKVLQCYTPQLPTDAIQQIQETKKEKLLDSDRILQLFFARQNCEPVS